MKRVKNEYQVSCLAVLTRHDTKVMRKIIAMRKRNRDDLAEEEALLEIYRNALGMA